MNNSGGGYVGPAGVHLCHDELLVVWKYLCFHADDPEAEKIRDKIANFLEDKALRTPR